jgi:hypothetical protein
MAAALALSLGFGALCCGAPEPPPASPAPAETAAPEAGQAVAGEAVSVPVVAVGLEGQPLPDIRPIATRRANAFDEPLARGPLTDADGRSHIALEGDDVVFVRGWDPNHRRFANNHWEILPDEAVGREALELQMVPGGILRLEALTPDDTPMSHADIRLMLVHSSAGPWWPTRGRTDGTGAVVFPVVPAGRWTLHLLGPGDEQAEVRGVEIQPRGRTDLGAVPFLEEGSLAFDYADRPDARHPAAGT